MSDLSDYLEDQLVNHIFRTNSYTKPTVLGIALFTSDPTDAGSGAEVSGGSYARIDVPPLNANWAATSGTDGKTSNVSIITFPSPTANWGTVTHMGVYDALSGGNLLFGGPMVASLIVDSGDPAPTIAAGVLTVTFA